MIIPFPGYIQVSQAIQKVISRRKQLDAEMKDHQLVLKIFHQLTKEKILSYWHIYVLVVTIPYWIY